MAKTKISEFSSTPGNNTDIDGINVAEGCAPSGINDAIRELMSQLKDFQTGSAGDSFNGPVGTTTAAAGAFTTLSASSTVSGTGFSTYLASPPAIGGTTAAAGSFTTLSASSTVTLSGGTANGVLYLNGSKVATSGTALTFDGTNFGVGVTPSAWSGFTGLQVGPSGSVSNSGTGTPVTAFSNNAYYNGTSWVYINTGAAAQYQQSTSQHIWRYAASGSGNITWSEAMRLDTSGNLGIGTSSPAATLDVQVASPSAQVKATTGTNRVWMRVNNTGGDFYFGRENSAGNFFGVTAYSSVLWSQGAYPMVFATDNTERARIDSSGNLLVGTTSNAGFGGSVIQSATSNGNPLLVRHSGSTASDVYGQYIQFNNAAPNNATNYFLQAQDNVALRAQIRSNGGFANYQANDTNLSDRREKTNFAPAGEYLPKICAIPVQTFNYIDQNMEEDTGLTLGIVAQDVQAVAPELVMESNWGTQEEPKMRLSVYQTDLQYALMKCIQEQQALINDLRARVAQLEVK